MGQIRAFVGHSFIAEDQPVVAAFLEYFNQMKGALPDFDWTHAREAQPTELAAKVLKLIEGANTFIGICTRRERVVDNEKLRSSWLDGSRKSVADDDLDWKTSDWIIQEIGLAIGRNMAVVLLVEKGCRRPGGLQGDVEFIPFDRSAPERAFGRLLEMMKALSPPTGVGQATSPEIAPDKTDSVQPTPEDEEDNPDETWDRQRYENAFLWKLISRENEAAKKIEAGYLASKDAADPEKIAAWTSMAEVWRFRFSDDGSLHRLRECSAKFPSNVEIAANLADGLAILKMHSEAAKQYLRASELASPNRVEMERLRGLAAVQFFEAGDKVEAQAILKEQRRALPESEKDEELNYLSRASEILLGDEKKYGEIEILERRIQLSPEDWDSRFSLAYKFSQIGLTDLALYHYLQIPYGERSAMAWNNLGVCYQNLSLAAKCVDAYRIASSKGETLAMSNLAYRFMNAGFVKEADDELQKAIKIENFHRNVGEAIATLKDMPEEEKKSLDETLKKTEPKRNFFKQLGEAIAFPDIDDLPEMWTGPDCDLAVGVEKGRLFAVGQFERTNTGALSTLLSGEKKTTIHRLTYKGNIRGRRVLGTLTKKTEGEQPSGGLLGIGGDAESEFAMVIARDKTIISVVEQPSTSSPRFYTLWPKDSVSAGT